MAIKTRTELKANFQNGRIPTAQHFADFIDSALVRRDDHFFGHWQPGVAYYNGDVVLWGKKLYILEWYGPVDLPPAPPVSDASARAGGAKPVVSKDPYCNSKSPDLDATHWKELELTLKDDDWTIAPDKSYINAFSAQYRVGIGIDAATKPAAKLDVREPGRGLLQFNPDNTAKNKHQRQDTELRLSAIDYPDCTEQPWLSARLSDEYAHLTTNTKKGFSLEYDKPAETDKNMVADETLMVVVAGPEVSTAGSKSSPRVGIGEDDPKGPLHVKIDENGDLQIKSNEQQRPEIRLFNRLDSKYLTESVAPDFATFATDAESGFRFSPASNDGKKGSQPAAENVVVIDECGHIGVGTEQPNAHLEVKRPEWGALQVCLEQANPALAILNLKPNPSNTDPNLVGKPYNTYLTLGADNSYAVVKTDAPCGFVFKREEWEKNKSTLPERNINTGQKEVFIDQQGKVGIGVSPDGYELDVQAKLRCYEAYLAHNNDTIDCVGNLEKGLEIVCGLKPVRFKWRDTLGGVLDPDKEGFALLDYQCADIVPELVKTTGKDEKSIDYQGFIPVLIRAIQQQQDTIQYLYKQLADIRKQLEKE